MTNITQVGIATASESLVTHISNRAKSTMSTDNLSDYPSYSGQNGRYLSVTGNPGSESMSWVNLPPTGLVWQNQDTSVLMEGNIGYLAAGGLTLTLPADPADGDLVAISDRDGVFAEDPVTVLTSNSDTIQGNSSLTLDLINTYIQLIYGNGTWNITNVNHPSNIAEITEEVFPAGSYTYYLSRIPPSRASIMVIYRGAILTADQYSIQGNALTFSTLRLSNVNVRYLGLPVYTPVTDTPVGTCALFPRLPAPDGWLITDGSTVSATSYPELVKYLAKDSSATSAVLPPPNGWSATDEGASTNIPANLSDNTWGKWLDTTHAETSINAWDDNIATSTSVQFAYAYVGYRFDIPVIVTSIDIDSSETNAANLPTSLLLEYSNDNITWSVASAGITGGAPINNTVVNVPNTLAIGTSAKYWRVIGTGGSARSNGSGLYWGIRSVTINGSTTYTRVDGTNLVQCIKASSLQGNSASSNSTKIAALEKDIKLLKTLLGVA